jgi:Flp pilus assembly pilin Flp
MRKLKNAVKAMWKDESAQGATEYILLLVVVISLVFIFKKPIMEAVKGKMDDVKANMGDMKVEKE